MNGNESATTEESTVSHYRLDHHRNSVRLIQFASRPILQIEGEEEMFNTATVVNAYSNVLNLPARKNEQPLREYVSSQPQSTVKSTRKRGVVLTQAGWQKLMQAGVLYDDVSRRYTHEQLSERTLLDVRTISRILSCEVKVDKRTLKTFFRTFNLLLESADYTIPDEPTSSTATSSAADAMDLLAEKNLTIEELITLKQSMMQDLNRIFDLLSLLDDMSESAQRA